MSKLHLSILFFIIALVIKESHGTLAFDFNTQVIVPAFTPFKRNGDINVAVIKKMAEKFAEDNIKTILIGSYAGEGPSMDLCTRQVLVSAWVKAGVPRGLKIIVDVGALAFTDVLKFVKFCSETDVTAIFVLPEIFYKAKTVNEIIEDLKAIYNVAPQLSLIFHDLRFLTNSIVNIIEMFIEASSKIPTFLGIATEFNTAVDLRRIIGPTTDKVIIVIGSNVNVPLALKLGIHLSLWPSLFPKLVFKIVAAINAGDCDKAAYLQSKLDILIKATSLLKGEINIDFASRCKFLHKKLVTKDPEIKMQSQVLPKINESSYQV